MTGAASQARGQHQAQDAGLDDEARAFKRGRAPLLIAVVANVVLSGALLGVPYIRGQQHAAQSVQAFSEFAACLLDGHPQQEPGLALPPGDRARFGAQAVSAAADWPSRCESALAQVAPPESTFLWPSVKTAGNDVRRAVDILNGELVELRTTVDAEQAVPQRPLLIVSKLRAALVLMARSAHLTRDLDRSAISLETPPGLQPPTRLPLVASVAAPTTMWTTSDSLQLLAADRMGISWLKLREGSVARRRPRRTGLVRGTLVSAGVPYVVWATRESRCQNIADSCSRKSTGIAPFDFHSNQLPQPRWVRGHPAGPLESHLFLKGKVLTLLSRSTVESQLVLQTFELKFEGPSELVAGKPGAPMGPQTSAVLDGGTAIGTSMLLDDAGALLLAEVEGGFASKLYGSGGSHQVLPAVRGQRPWSQQCQSGHNRAITYGTGVEMRAVTLRGNARLTWDVTHDSMGGSTERVEFASANTGEKSGFYPVEMNCDAHGFSLVYRDATQQLWGQRCGYTVPCAAPVKLANRATTHASLLHQGKLVVAYTEKKYGQIHVQVDGELMATISPCFSPRAGMCGAPILHQAGPRLILAAREGADVLVLESTDGARHFHPLPGFAEGGTASGGGEALRQHRRRKGID